MKSTNLFACESYFKRFTEAILKKKGIQYTNELDLDCSEEGQQCERLTSGTSFSTAE